LLASADSSTAITSTCQQWLLVYLFKKSTTVQPLRGIIGAAWAHFWQVVWSVIGEGYHIALSTPQVLK